MEAHLKWPEVVMMTPAISQNTASGCNRPFNLHIPGITSPSARWWSHPWRLALTSLKHSPSHAENKHEFANGVDLFYDRLSVAQFNQDKPWYPPVAAIVHSSPEAAAIKADAGTLFPVIFLAKCACVMLTANVWPLQKEEVGKGWLLGNNCNI